MSPEIYAGIDPMERKLFRGHLPDTSAGAIAAIVFKYFDVNIIERTGSSRKREFVQARQIAMYIIRKKTNATLKNIGCFFNRDHTTVIYAIEATQDQIDTNIFYKRDVDKLLNLTKDVKAEKRHAVRIQREAVLD